MLNLKEYRSNPDRLSDYLPWAALVAPGVILNKDGSFQKTFKFRGMDLDSVTDPELESITLRLNNILKRLTGGWAIFTEARRRRSEQYPKANFDNPLALMLDEERRVFFESGVHYESDYYLTLVYLPPEEKLARFEKLFIQRSNQKTELNYQLHLKTFLSEVERVYNLFSELMAETRALNDDETVTYLHSCISPKSHFVKASATPMYLDAFLVDTPLSGGFEPRLGDYHLRVITIYSFPGESVAGMLDNLNHLGFEYRWVTRFIPLNREDAQKELESQMKNWNKKVKKISTIIKEELNKEESIMFDRDALNKVTDTDLALQELGADLVSYGYFTTTITIIDKDLNHLEKKVLAVEKIINSLGFNIVVETVNAVDAWFSSLPGHCQANVRRPLLNSLNFTHLFPLSTIWAGPEQNNHLKNAVLLQTQTEGNTPFRLDLHLDDVGHTFIVGPTGAGKSVHLGILAAQFLKYPQAQIYFFDKGGSSRALTAGIGGDFYDLAAEGVGELSFQPLANIDDIHERSWAMEWLHSFLLTENLELTPKIKEAIWEALSSLATSPKKQRTITGFVGLLQDIELRMAFEPLTINGAYGKIFDADQDTLNIYGRWQVFEMEQLMQAKAAVAPTLSYLFHRLEQRFRGVPTLLVLDECWLFLDNSIFAAKLREWLKVLRKANVAVVFATQSLQDIEKSSIAAAIIDSCQTKIYLPNANALDERTAKIYDSFGLNARELEILALSCPKRHYYYKSSLGCRVYELALGAGALAYCGAGSKDDQRKVKEILKEYGHDGFNEAWLRYKNLPEASVVIKELSRRMKGEGES